MERQDFESRATPYEIPTSLQKAALRTLVTARFAAHTELARALGVTEPFLRRALEGEEVLPPPVVRRLFAQLDEATRTLARMRDRLAIVSTASLDSLMGAEDIVQ